MRIASLLLAVLVATSFLAGSATTASAQDEWKKFPRPSFPYQVRAATIHGGDLVVGGHFFSVHDVPAQHVARWNGSGWEALGDGASSRVTALTTYGGDLCNAVFNHGTVNRFDGVSWQTLGTFQWSGVGFVEIRAMFELEGNLVVGGRFDEVDGIPAAGVAVFDGVSWSSLAGGPAGADEAVTELGLWQGDLVAAGEFTVAGGGAADGIARWTGTAWVPIGSGFPNPAQTLLEFNGELWAGFWSSIAGSEVRRWDGVNWIDAGAGVSDLTGFFGTTSRGVLDLMEFNGDLYLGGSFNTGYTSPGYMAGRWNGSSWETFGGLDGYGEDFGGTFTFNCLVPWNSKLVLAGYFPFVAWPSSTQYIQNIVAWTGTEFERVTNDELGLDRNAYDIAAATDGIVVAGSFDEAGIVPTGPVARWDGAAWNAYGALESDRIDGYLNAIEFDGTDLLVGGGITMPDATTASVARFDGASWSRLGTGNEPSTGDLIWFEGSLVAAMGDQVSEWSGTSWDALGTGLPVDVGVSALAVYEGQLHAAGAFDYSGYPDVALFRLDGSAWTSLAPVGTYSPGRAYVMAVHDGSLLVGGDMDGVGETASPGLIEWDGSSWSGRTTSMTNSVRAIASTSRGLVIGGSFRDLNGKPDVDGIAREDPVDGWVSVAGAPSSGVYVLAPVDDSVWVGGSFSWADGGSSVGVTVWNPATGTWVGEPVSLRQARVQVVPNPFNPNTTIHFEVEAPSGVDVTIFDAAGRVVRRVLVAHRYEAGPQTVTWDGRDDGGVAVASGIYLVRVLAGDQVMHGKMALVR